MLETITLQVIEVAKQAGAFIRQERSNFKADSIEYKGLNDLVSYVDKTAEGMIVEGLAMILPEAGFLTEEKTINRTGERYNWIIDPLDGTTNFIHGLTVFAVSIALKEYDELVAGVVYEVNLDECFYACKGAPAYLNGKEIHVSKAPKIADSLLATGFPYYDFTKQPQYIALFTDLMQHCHGLRRLGSAATDLAYTACGRFDGFYEYNLKPWDIAAGIVIVRQAGGKVVSFTGGNDVLETCDVVATNGLIGDELVGKIGEYFV
ncbi:inositol monophosphatase family protein [Mucilaginibacter polytrichastri]|uniref:Inositol-1-monophosphatase n=1 Tax=Mucilaginibacter polytrichastri TaxID=1302689 RepID=A0A1Q5ZWR4_9SPHI|nr:inositol monophosphatase family protein [Mucilaginibacter polytrichastri]OKS86205.1 Inositol-1-monophosphatase [Mucilaginibacter polytrichastri]SFT15918.1 myo-inositol-1(or 4)-monophosphatase [Mucilaginibacter polytrichastri]